MLAWQHLTTVNWCTKYTNRTGVSLFDYSDEEVTGGRSGRFRYLTKYEK